MNFLLGGLITFVLIGSSYFDIKKGIIPNKLILPALLIILIVRIFYHPNGLIYYLFGLIPAIVLFIAAMASKGEGVGGGDIKLMAFIGLTLGSYLSVLAFFYTLVVSILGYFILWLLKYNRTKSIRMAPYFAMGTCLSLLHIFLL
ncbi:MULTISPECIES: prepilin peptidase [Bacillota]|uniref:prepilin peptidase n=1 Tax=Bacillota TaxID=1239 RepID=UPI0039F03B8C